MLLAASIFLLGYFVGSIPCGFIAGRFNGIDIRNFGSGNIGATNVLRVMGKPIGFAVFAADAAKGFVAVSVTSMLLALAPGAEWYREFYAILAAASCVFGHSFPVWLRFNGGKGVATSAGAILGVMPIAALTIFLVWLTVFKITRYVSIASIFAALALPGVVWVLMFLGLTRGTVLFYFSILMAALVVWRHRSNIARLAAGTEQRFARK